MKTLINLLLLMPVLSLFAQNNLESDLFLTPVGELRMSFVGHGTLMFELDSLVIHIDPVSREANYENMPDADLILITHHHGDHFDIDAINEILKYYTRVVLTSTVLDRFKHSEGLDIRVLSNYERIFYRDIEIQAIPAYNMVHKRENGQAFHPKGIGNGYILSFGDFRVLVAGDTENIPEIKALKDIDVAFLPMNLPYTMSPEMVADAAKAFKPKVLYPYHYGETNTNKLIDLMKDTPEVDLRIREF